MQTQKNNEIIPAVSMRLIIKNDNVTNVTSSDARMFRFASPEDPTINQTMRLIEQSGSDFWNDESEDIYTIDDGEEI